MVPCGYSRYELGLSRTTDAGPFTPENHHFPTIGGKKRVPLPGPSLRQTPPRRHPLILQATTQQGITILAAEGAGTCPLAPQTVRPPLRLSWVAQHPRLLPQGRIAQCRTRQRTEEGQRSQPQRREQVSSLLQTGGQRSIALARRQVESTKWQGPRRPQRPERTYCATIRSSPQAKTPGHGCRHDMLSKTPFAHPWNRQAAKCRLSANLPAPGESET